MELTGKKILVVGAGISGIAAVNLVFRAGASVTLYDGNTSLDKEKMEQSLAEGVSAEVILGETLPEWKKMIDLVIVSPGVPTDLPFLLELKESGIPVWGEIELAFRSGRGLLCAITGTNGKTTTTALLGQIMKMWKSKGVYVVGNIGLPYTTIAEQTKDDSVVVVEVSSFQLETVENFKPKVSTILNISPDHLNRHHTMEKYIEAKKNIAANQTEQEVCVLNYEDEVTKAFGEETSASVFWFSSKRRLDKGIYTVDGTLIYNDGMIETQLCQTGELHILGKHNHENAMAAAAMAISAGVPIDVIREGLLAFTAVEHRIEYVAEKSGVAYYNDSKGTNPDAAIKGVQAMDRPTLLIGGGYDKDSDYTDWIQAFDGKVKLLVLVGDTREKIAEAAEREGFRETVFADTFEEAVEICCERAEAGDAVLLSPACASWGMFDNYEQRGNKFKELVYRLKE